MQASHCTGEPTEGRRRTSIQIDLPDKLAAALATMVQQGWFCSEAEVLRVALLEFLRRHRRELHEQCQRDDIAWALRQQDAVE